MNARKKEKEQARIFFREMARELNLASELREAAMLLIDDGLYPAAEEVLKVLLERGDIDVVLDIIKEVSSSDIFEVSGECRTGFVLMLMGLSDISLIADYIDSLMKRRKAFSEHRTNVRFHSLSSYVRCAVADEPLKVTATIF